MRRLLAIIIFWFVAGGLLSQIPYGHEWINYNQQYVKLPVYKEGIYRIDAPTLAAAFGNGTNPKNLQLFLAGREQFVFVRGENDGQLDAGDYLEFYATPSSRETDSSLYNGASWLPNPYAALFNDTIYAFLTVNNQLTNKRYVPETDTNSVIYPAGNWFYANRVYAPQGSYNRVNEFPFDVSDPNYSQAEGKGLAFAKGSSLVTPFTNLNPYTATSLPAYVLTHYSGNSLAGTGANDHRIQISYSDQNNSTVQVADTVFRGFVAVRKRFSVSSQNMNNTTNLTISSVADAAFASHSNNTVLHFIRLDYPHSMDLGGASTQFMNLGNGGGGKQFFSFENVSIATGDSALLYDVRNGRRIRTVINSPQQVRAVIPDGIDAPVCYLSAGAEVIPVTTLYKVTPSGYFTNFKNNVGPRPYLLVYPSAFQTSATEYRNYRQTAPGNAYNVVFANVEELYAQFAYGVNKHPAAVRNFSRLMYDSLPSKPLYLFLLGKGVSPMNLNNGAQAVNFVPSMGVPASDNLLTVAMSPTNTERYVPQLPVGRLAAINENEVRIYLAKIQQHESSGQQDWKKRALHFVGGDTPELANVLDSYMTLYKEIIKDSLFGAEVFTYRKNTTAPVQTSISDSIRRTLSNGAALLTFFGHGSEQGFDQAIDDPEQYNNKGRYPLVIANSCYSGDIHIPTRRSVSERFIIADQKGSIGFLATTSYGFLYSLNIYSIGLYRALSATRYDQGIGDFIQQACVQSSSSGEPLTRFTGLDMTLNGDPALRISNGLKPDYQLKNNDISFDLRTHTDSVGVRINMKNAGKAIRDSFFVKIERFFPDGDSSNTFRRVKAPMFRDSLKVFLPLDFARGIGLNRLRVKLDEFGDITENVETNNATSLIDLFIPGGDLLPVYPYKFAIVPKTNTIVLKASTSDPFAPLSAYRFQLDTTDSFTQPLQSARIQSKGGVLTWTVNLPYADSTVYFWRVSRDSTAPNTPFIWKESSFQTVGQKNGWAQAHFHQFKSDEYRFVNYKRPQRAFVFQNNKHSVFCRNGMSLGVGITYAFNNMIRSNWGCGPDGWNFAVFDSISGEPQLVVSPTAPAAGIYNNCICVDNQVLSYYSFGASNYCGFTNWKTDMENFLNAVAPNNYVLAFTVGTFNTPGYAQITTYSNALYTAFESIGAVNIRNVKDTVPYILFGKKGMNAGQGHEVVGGDSKSIITLSDSIQTRWNSGYVASTQIGPAYKWNSLHWRVKSLDNNAGDTTTLKLVGIRNNGQIDTLQSFPTDSMDVLNLQNYVNADTYPYLRLVAFMKDNVNRTSPQLKRWQVLYDEAPECAINPLKGYAGINDTLQEGDEVTFIFPIENVGERNFEDSLVVTYWIEDNNRNTTALPSRLKKRPVVPGEVLMDTLRLSSYQLAGDNALWVYVNPGQHSRYQKEQQQFNNLGRVPFRVDRDRTNPLMDVTFDGVRILNGDLVSARPEILITLKDENKFLPLNDTSAFTIFLQSPNQTQLQRIYFGQGLVFTPASLPKNSASINYNPVLPIDGRYTLVVQAQDRSRNISASQDYRVQFEVQNKPTVTNVLNYPNPFSTSTRFVFTLTGSEVPEVFTIRILTISGKVIREITRNELGHLHIGRNITEYAWDGRDDYGDRLANGVYLYQVLTKLNGENIEKATSGADKYITREFGKMVIMR